MVFTIERFYCNYLEWSWSFRDFAVLFIQNTIFFISRWIREILRRLTVIYSDKDIQSQMESSVRDEIEVTEDLPDVSKDKYSPNQIEHLRKFSLEDTVEDTLFVRSVQKLLIKNPNLFSTKLCLILFFGLFYLFPLSVGFISGNETNPGPSQVMR